MAIVKSMSRLDRPIVPHLTRLDAFGVSALSAPMGRRGRDPRSGRVRWG
jgi:hypothetical protein